MTDHDRQDSDGHARGSEAMERQLGGYDGLLILSASDETKVLHMLTELAALGNVRTQTMQAFVDTEFDEIVGR